MDVVFLLPDSIRFSACSVPPTAFPIPQFTRTPGQSHHRARPSELPLQARLRIHEPFATCRLVPCLYRRGRLRRRNAGGRAFAMMNIHPAGVHVPLDRRPPNPQRTLPIGQSGRRRGRAETARHRLRRSLANPRDRGTYDGHDWGYALIAVPVPSIKRRRMLIPPGTTPYSHWGSAACRTSKGNAPHTMSCGARAGANALKCRRRLPEPCHRHSHLNLKLTDHLPLRLR